jgi:hypothetical protein
MKKIVLLFLCISSGLFAQNKFTISGFVKEKSSAEELIGANIVSEALSIGVTTNAYGFYSLTLPEGDYKIRYSFIGYQDTLITLSLIKSERLDVEMTPYAQELSEIVLEADAIDKIRSIEMSVNKLQTKAVKQLAAVAGEVDIIKTIQLLPGVTSVGEGANGFNVRGGSADENLVLLDEMTLYNTSHLFGFFSVFTQSVRIIRNSIVIIVGVTLITQSIKVRIKLCRVRNLRTIIDVIRPAVLIRIVVALTLRWPLNSIKVSVRPR